MSKHDAHHHTHPHHHRQASHSAASAVFIKQAAVPAQLSEARSGVPASITIAQAILESGWGRHHMGSANNYFGVKAHSRHGHINTGPVAVGSVDMPTSEYVHGKKVHVMAPFRKYASMNDSFIDHGLFLRDNHRYASAIQEYAKTRDADQFAAGIQRAGYATDPSYARLLVGLMKKHNLYQYNLPVPK